MTGCTSRLLITADNNSAFPFSAYTQNKRIAMNSDIFDLKLNKQQADAVKHIDGAVLLLAVPGSGKTTVLTARLGYMIKNAGIAPDSILVLTYTVAAANEMKARFAKLFGSPDGKTPEFRTINGVAQRIINDFAYFTGREPFALITDEKRVSAVISAIYREATLEFATDSIISDIRRRITCAKNSMMTEAERKTLETEDIPFEEVFAKYQEWLKTNRLMDYDDQLVYALTMLRNYPDLRRRYVSKYKYVCVDEAQDTSKIQHCIIKLLTDGNGNIFMVGDEDQSIYGFRGADPEFLLNFDKNYPGATILKSEENFRSTPEITRAADAFIGRNTLRINKKMSPFRTDRGYLREEKVRDIPMQYDRLMRLLPKSVGRVAVLYRNNECALPLIDIMMRSGCDFSCRDTDCTFFTNKTVLDITSILRLAENGGCTDAFMKIYYKLGLYLSKSAAERVCADVQKNGGEILSHLLKSGVLTEQAQKRCGEIRKTLHRIASGVPTAAVFFAAHLPGYSAYGGIDENKVEILTAIAGHEKSVSGFLDRLEVLREAFSHGFHGSGRLTLSTVHSAKGLEFDTVYILSAVDGILPSEVPKNPADPSERAAYEEERRLFYVAVTRAKNDLTVFTFDSDKYVTSFSDELFGKETKIVKSFSPVAAPHGAGFTVDARSFGGSGADADGSDGFNVGTKLHHRHFGIGEVTARNGDIITVQFVKGKVRRMSASHLKRKKLAEVR